MFVEFNGVHCNCLQRCKEKFPCTFLDHTQLRPNSVEHCYVLNTSINTPLQRDERKF